MSVVESLREVPALAADRLIVKGHHKGGWTGEDGSECLHQAVRACSPQPGDGYIVSALLAAQGYDFHWNDRESDRDSVLALLRGMDITDAMLAEAFGPEWRAFVTVVRQAATLTPSQADALSEAAGDAWAAARAAAGDAWAARAAWAAARAAVGDAWAAEDAARAAALALIATPHVGTNGLEQQHIETLLAPWIAVMGDPRGVTA